jgi:trans-2,3-dihydro-3-hydroxyanthranilate isomerase
LDEALVYLYTQTTDGVDIHAPMFAPLSGVPEDPATGSVGCALAALLAEHNGQTNGEFLYRIAQGVEMGRPSMLIARAEKSGGIVKATWVGSVCVLVNEGLIRLA